MARRVIEVDGANVSVVGEQPTIAEAIGGSGRGGVTSVVAGGEVLTPDKWNRPAPPKGMITNSVDIEKGGLRENLLDQECSLIAHRFLKQFPNGPTRKIIVGDNYDTITISNFPLPDAYRPDHTNLLICTVGYPNIPPGGFHIPDAPQGTVVTIRDRLKGHVMKDNNLPASYLKYVEELGDMGWTWICYHYQNWSWRLNSKNLMSGDCLYKYVENLYAEL